MQQSDFVYQGSWIRFVSLPILLKKQAQKKCCNFLESGDIFIIIETILALNPTEPAIK